MRATVAINVVGLSPSMVGPDTPNIARLSETGGMQPLHTVTPAVTCAAQVSYLTGSLPRDHVIVGKQTVSLRDGKILLEKMAKALEGE